MKKRIPLIQQIVGIENNPQFIQQHSTEEQAQTQDRKKLIKPKKGKCIVCKKDCNYACPKCKKNYCNAEHYRSHNLFCSEAFFLKQVVSNLKGLKVTDKIQKKKIADMVNQHQQQLADCQIQADLTEQRLQQILTLLNQGNIQSIKLTPKQQYLFDAYVSSLSQDSSIDASAGNRLSDVKNIEIQKGYWQIQDGLCMYLMNKVEIQQLNESQHQELMIQRAIFKQQLQQFKKWHPYQQNMVQLIKPIVNSHIFQLVYTYVALWRAYDGQSSQFTDILCQAYISKQNQAILRREDLSIGIFIQTIAVELQRLDPRGLLNMWLSHTYKQIVLNDVNCILNNVYLLIQTLLRIRQSINLKFNQYTGTNKNEGIHLSKCNQSTQLSLQLKIQEKIKKLDKNQKKKVIIYKKIIKKCQYLLYTAIYKYKKQVFTNIMEQFVQYSQKKRLYQSEFKEHIIYRK